MSCVLENTSVRSGIPLRRIRQSIWKQQCQNIFLINICEFIIINHFQLVVRWTYIAIDFGSNDGAAAVENGVELLNHIEEGLVRQVLQIGASPRHVTQLRARQLRRHTARARGRCWQYTRTYVQYMYKYKCLTIGREKGGGQTGQKEYSPFHFSSKYFLGKIAIFDTLMGTGDTRNSHVSSQIHSYGIESTSLDIRGGGTRNSVSDWTQEVRRLNELLQNVYFGRHREAVVQHFIEDLNTNAGNEEVKILVSILWQITQSKKCTS